MGLVDLSASELLDQLRSGKVSSLEVTQACLDAIAARDPAIHAFLHVDADDALNQAAAIDDRRAKGEPLGLLAGLPIALKDVVCQRGQPATCASRMLERFVAPYDAHAVTKLRQADAVLLGRTNLDEFAMGSSSENSAFGVTRNPWDPSRIPGGSSAGSAAAVAARMTPISLGSDTGGSIRQPAGLCGIVGMKPTYGRISRYGLIAYASSLDQIGAFGTDVRSVATAIEAMSGHDGRDSTSVNQPVVELSKTVDQPLKGLKIGIVPEHFGAGLDSEIAAAVQKAIDVYKHLGAEVREVTLPHAKYCIATYYLIACSEASSNLSRYDGVHYGHRAESFENLTEMYAKSRGEAFGPEVKRRIMLGTYALSTGYYDQYYVKALKVRRLIRQDFDAAFEQVDVIAGPVTPTAAFPIGEKANDPLAMYLGDIYTISANLAGLPAIALPCGFTTNNLPIGMQLQGRPFDEERVLRAARMFEAATDWHTRKPSG
ncbi:MAG TPA: Asp-tRNA(Asn)/Glu-tRNA(Gln) amidotransferase subunit GatA [Planctomycetaceae bacterium]|nr:Asp-tRNA(Asn)/Glu-tRNA(Gln) amidotransferase subunit GatA [Planctomycetaceae bacterium]